MLSLWTDKGKSSILRPSDPQQESRMMSKFLSVLVGVQKDTELAKDLIRGICTAYVLAQQAAPEYNKETKVARFSNLTL